jgi:hypothetical protein
MKIRTLVAVACIGAVIIFSLGWFAIANNAAFTPSKTGAITFDVYDANTNKKVGSVGAGGTFSGGDKYPDVDCFASQPFFCDATGITMTKSDSIVSNIVVNGIDYIVTEYHEGIDFGSETHVRLGSLSHQTLYGASVSPFEDAGYTHTDYYSNQFGDTWTASKYPKVVGSLVYTDDAFVGGSLSQNQNWVGNNPNVVWGSDQGKAKITQSLAPFYATQTSITYTGGVTIFGVNIGGTPHLTTSNVAVTDLNSAWFSNSQANNQGYQQEFLKNNYKIAAVKIVPTINLVAQGNPVLYDYNQTVTLPNGTRATMTVNTASTITGFRNAYIANPGSGLSQSGLVQNLHPANWAVPVPSNPSNTTSNTPSDPPAEVANSVNGRLWYTGDVDCGYITGAASGADNVGTSLNQAAKDYHFDMSNPDSLGTMPSSITLNTTFTLQPYAYVKWATMNLESQYYIWDGADGPFNCYGWSIGPYAGAGSGTNIIYPYSISVDNVYAITRVVIDCFTISRNTLELSVAGKPVDGKLFTDNELTGLLNNPAVDDIVQTLPIPQPINWWAIIAVIIITLAIILALVIVVKFRRHSGTTNVFYNK